MKTQEAYRLQCILSVTCPVGGGGAYPSLSQGACPDWGIPRKDLGLVTGILPGRDMGSETEVPLWEGPGTRDRGTPRKEMGPEVGNGPGSRYWGTSGMTHTCENITFPHHSVAVDNKFGFSVTVPECSIDLSCGFALLCVTQVIVFKLIK